MRRTPRFRERNLLPDYGRAERRFSLTCQWDIGGVYVRLGGTTAHLSVRLPTLSGPVVGEAPPAAGSGNAGSTRRLDVVEPDFVVDLQQFVDLQLLGFVEETLARRPRLLDRPPFKRPRDDLRASVGDRLRRPVVVGSECLLTPKWRGRVAGRRAARVALLLGEGLIAVTRVVGREDEVSEIVGQLGDLFRREPARPVGIVGRLWQDVFDRLLPVGLVDLAPVNADPIILRQVGLVFEEQILDPAPAVPVFARFTIGEDASELNLRAVEEQRLAKLLQRLIVVNRVGVELGRDAKERRMAGVRPGDRAGGRRGRRKPRKLRPCRGRSQARLDTGAWLRSRAG